MSTDTTKTAKPAGPGHFLILFPLWLLVFSAGSQIMIIAPILPQLGEQLQIASHMQGTLITAYAFMVGLFALIMGPVSDRIGRRRILLYGSLAMTVALALHAAATDYISLLLVRAVAGAAGGVLSGSAVSYVGDFFPYERRGWANGWIMSGTAAGQVVGIPLGTMMAEWFSFYAPFWMFSITMGIAFLLIWYFVPQPDVERNETRLTVRQVLLQYVAMVQKPEIAAASGAYFVMFLSIGLYIVYLPTWLTQHVGMNGQHIAMMFLIGGIANVITGPQAGRLSDQIGRKSIIVASCVGTSLVMFVTTFVIREIYIANTLFFVIMVLVAMRISPFQSLLSEIVSGKNRGTLMSLTVSLGQLGFGLGGSLAGWAFTNSGYMLNTLISAFTILLTGFVVWKFLPEPALKPHDS